MSTRIASLTDDDLWKLAHETADARSRSFDVTVVPEILSLALTVELVQGIVDNGGVEYLLGPNLPDGLDYPDCVRAFKLIDSWLCAEALGTVYGAFPGGSPNRSNDARKMALDGLLETRRELLDHASRVFWNASQSNYAAALRLLRAHPEVFDAAA